MKKLFLVVIAMGLTAYLVLPMPGQSRSLNDKIERKQRQVQHKRAREGVLTQDISSYSTRIRGLQGDIRSYASREAKLQGSLQRKRAEVQRVQDKLEVAQDRLVRLRARLKQATDVLSARLVEIYKDDEPDVLTVVLESDGFADMLDRTAFLERISQQDRTIVTRVRELKKQTKELTDQLSQLEEQKQNAADAILAQKNQVAAARAHLVERQGDLANARSKRRTLLASAREDRAHLEGDLKSLERQQAAVRARIQAAQASAASSSGGGGAGGGSANAPIKRESGGLIWPVNGPVVSPFGMRWGRLHAGVDIAVPSGTPVHAAQSGRVIIAGVVGGYGNYICIAHGGSLSTCYGHNSSLGVSQGQSVKQGQVISSSGCTGHCFGPHVHFETRINGSPVDPMGYL
jgi:murein DD-endopeptidase MepM/ murein hydrolase activator NlpD